MSDTRLTHRSRLGISTCWVSERCRPRWSLDRCRPDIRKPDPLGDPPRSRPVANRPLGSEFADDTRWCHEQRQRRVRTDSRVLQCRRNPVQRRPVFGETVDAHVFAGRQFVDRRAVECGVHPDRGVEQVDTAGVAAVGCCHAFDRCGPVPIGCNPVRHSPVLFGRVTRSRERSHRPSSDRSAAVEPPRPVRRHGEIGIGASHRPCRADGDRRRFEGFSMRFDQSGGVGDAVGRDSGWCRRRPGLTHTPGKQETDDQHRSHMARVHSEITAGNP